MLNIAVYYLAHRFFLIFNFIYELIKLFLSIFVGSLEVENRSGSIAEDRQKYSNGFYSWYPYRSPSITLSKRKSKFPRYDMKCRGKRDNLRNIPRSISFPLLYVSCYISENLYTVPLGQCTSTVYTVLNSSSFPEIYYGV